MRKSNTILDEKAVNICPRCNQYFVRQQMSGDFQHQCHNNDTLQNESIFFGWNWTDFTGSNTNTQSNRLSAPIPNQLQGTRAGLEGGKNETRDARGYPVSRFRSRQFIKHIDTKELKTKQEIETDDIETYEDTD